MSRMACSAGSLLLMVFCLIFVPYGHCDEPEKLPYENHSICPKGADVRHGTKAGDTTRIDVKLSQESLGQMLGSTRESINKGLKSLEHKGLIETKSGHISVLDMDALEDFAEHQDDD